MYNGFCVCGATFQFSLFEAFLLNISLLYLAIDLPPISNGMQIFSKNNATPLVGMDALLPI